MLGVEGENKHCAISVLSIFAAVQAACLPIYFYSAQLAAEQTR